MQEKSAQYDTIGHRIREFCAHKYLSVNDFAQSMGMDAGNVQAYMRGARKPGTKVLSRLESLGCNSSWILTGKGEMLSGKQPLNSREDEIKRTFKVEDESGYYRSGSAYMVPAIGPLQTPEKIKEGDVLFIDPQATPEDGDFVLVKTPEGPKIDRYKTGEAIVGVLVKLIRERSIIRQQ
jgi:phage repressor protein C with HTH and peptisase S24 domain